MGCTGGKPAADVSSPPPAPLVKSNSTSSIAGTPIGGSPQRLPSPPAASVKPATVNEKTNSADVYEGVSLQLKVLCRDEFKSKYTKELMYRWRPAEIIKIEGEDRRRCLVHYTGWAESFDHWVHMDNDAGKIAPIDMLSKEQCTKGTALDNQQLDETVKYFKYGTPYTVSASKKDSPDKTAVPPGPRAVDASSPSVKASMNTNTSVGTGSRQRIVSRGDTNNDINRANNNELDKGNPSLMKNKSFAPNTTSSLENSSGATVVNGGLRKQTSTPQQQQQSVVAPASVPIVAQRKSNTETKLLAPPPPVIRSKSGTTPNLSQQSEGNTVTRPVPPVGSDVNNHKNSSNSSNHKNRTRSSLGDKAPVISASSRTSAGSSFNSNGNRSSRMQPPPPPPSSSSSSSSVKTRSNSARSPNDVVDSTRASSSSSSSSSSNAISKGIARVPGPVGVNNPYTVGQMVDVMDIFFKKGATVPSQKWRPSEVLEVDGPYVVIHYLNWDHKYNEKLHVVNNSKRLAEFGTLSARASKSGGSASSVASMQSNSTSNNNNNDNNDNSSSSSKQPSFPPNDRYRASSKDALPNGNNNMSSSSYSSGNGGVGESRYDGMTEAQYMFTRSFSESRKRSEELALKIDTQQSEAESPIPVDASSAVSSPAVTPTRKKKDTVEINVASMSAEKNASNATDNGGVLKQVSLMSFAHFFTGGSKRKKKSNSPQNSNVTKNLKSENGAAKDGDKETVTGEEDDEEDVDDEDEKRLAEIAERESQFLEKLEATGLHVFSIEGDGNCLFRAVSHQLYLHQDMHDELRACVVEHLIRHRKRFEVFCFDVDFDEHIREMAKPGTWADDLEIRALEEITDRVIVIYSSNTENVTEPINNNFEERQLLSNVPPLTLSYHGQSHYNSIYDERYPLPLVHRTSRLLLRSRIALTSEDMLPRDTAYNYTNTNIPAAISSPPDNRSMNSNVHPASNNYIYERNTYQQHGMYAGGGRVGFQQENNIDPNYSHSTPPHSQYHSSAYNDNASYSGMNDEYSQVTRNSGSGRSYNSSSSVGGGGGGGGGSVDPRYYQQPRLADMNGNNYCPYTPQQQYDDQSVISSAYSTHGGTIGSNNNGYYNNSPPPPTANPYHIHYDDSYIQQPVYNHHPSIGNNYEYNSNNDPRDQIVTIDIQYQQQQHYGPAGRAEYAYERQQQGYDGRDPRYSNSQQQYDYGNGSHHGYGY